MPNLYECKKKSEGGGGIEVDHITIATNPTTTTYAQYDALDLTGMVVTATFTDGVTAIVTSAVTTSPASGATLDTAGTIPLTVEYGGKTASINLTVTAMTAISVTTQPTKTTYQPNEYLDLTGIVVTGTAGALSRNVTSGCTFSPADGTQLTTKGTITITVTYNGLTTSLTVTCSALPAWDSRGLSYNSWDTIQKYIAAGEFANVAAAGDTKSITLTNNEVITMVVANINTGTGNAGAYYPANTADFVAQNLMETGHVMNSTNTNVGGWNSCEMRSYLNTDVWAMLPSDIKAVIVEKTHLRTEGNQSTTLISASDKLWLCTNYEVGGTGQGESDANNINYPIFTDNASRIKYRSGQTSASTWWLSSPYTGNTTDFRYVNYAGNLSDNYANGALRIALGLRIG